MHKSFKKMAPAAALSLACFTQALQADSSDGKLSKLSDRISTLEQGRTSDYNPAARPVLQHGINMYFSGEFLWLKPYEDDLAMAASDAQRKVVQTTDPSSANSSLSWNTKNWKTKFGPGFRLGVGYNTPYDGWDVDLKWFHFKSRNSDDDDDNDNKCCTCTSCPGTFEPLYFPKDYSSGVTVPIVTTMDNKKWKLRVDELTLQLGRQYFVSNWLSLRPHAGVKSAWIHQRARVDYGTTGSTFITAFANSLPGTTTDHVRNKNNFWGVGLEGGLHLKWGVGYGISLYSRSDLALVWGKFDVSNSHTLDTGTTTLRQSHITDKFRTLRPIAELALGVRYDTTFNDGSWGLGAWIGWEHHLYWSQNKMLKFEGRDYNVLDKWDGDLSLTGLDIGLNFDF